MEKVFSYFTVVIGSIMIIFGLVFGYYLSKGYGVKTNGNKRLIFPPKAKLENKLVLLFIILFFIIGGILIIITH